MNLNKILITGTAGFIGFHLVSHLLESNYEIIGIDNINDYYDVNLKYSRLKIHGIDIESIQYEKKNKSKIFNNYTFIKADIANYDYIVNLMIQEKFDFVINLAAQAGVRYSIENPRAYIHSNIDGFLSILEGSRFSKVRHLIYASTSSVYGLNTKMPLNENMPTEHPMALYAATKKSNELMAHSYSHIFNLPTTGLRFFTVYGPWGRPDMALFLFTKAILNEEPIKVFNHGKMIRDFTYVGDIVESIKRLIEKPPSNNNNWDSENPLISKSSAPFQIFNIGNSAPITLMEYINTIEKKLNKNAIKEYLPMQEGDVPATHADVSSLENYINYKPETKIEIGISNFIDWYKKFYNS
jgi:UDP-glucuronate 4-epimerase